MKAEIKIYLVKPTRTGKTKLTKKIEGKKNEIVNRINEWIYKRVNKENYIKVTLFEVKIYNYKKQTIKKWNYIPTYDESIKNIEIIGEEDLPF